MTRAFLLVVSVAALAAGCSCENLRANTQVMATIDAEPGVRAAARQLVVRVYGAPGGQAGVPDALVQELPFPVSSADGWPTTVALAPEGRDPSRRYRIEAVALDAGGADVATVRAISGYVAEQTLWLRLVLLDRCIGVTCEDPGQTCIGPDQCGDATVDETMLPPWLRDAGAPGGDGGEVGCDPAECDDGLACTADYCDESGACAHTRRAAMCDDGNPCTDDACTGDPADGPSGCANVPNTLDCDDGVFCNGLDTCSAGVCAHAGDPCGTLLCEEATDRCLGCTLSAECPSRMEGAYGACGWDGVCDESATQARVVRTFSCEAGACVPADAEETRACTRDTDGTSCGEPSAGTWSCGGFSDVCDTTGTETRIRTEPTCAAGVCTSMAISETRPCGRTTDGMTCSDGLSCNGSDTCVGGTCVGAPCMDGGASCDAGACDDGVDCTSDVCNGSGGCSHVPDDNRCPPGRACEVPRCDAVLGCQYDTSRCNDASITPIEAGSMLPLEGGI